MAKETSDLRFFEQQSRDMLIVLQDFYSKGLALKLDLLNSLTRGGVKDARFVVSALLDLHICDSTKMRIAVIRQPEFSELFDIFELAQLKKKLAIEQAVKLLKDEGYEIVKHS